jgi:hypothetical protein
MMTLKRWKYDEKVLGGKTRLLEQVQEYDAEVKGDSDTSKRLLFNLNANLSLSGLQRMVKSCVEWRVWGDGLWLSEEMLDTTQSLSLI